MPSKVELGQLGVALLGLWSILEALSNLAVLAPFVLSDDGILYGGSLQFLPLVVWIFVAAVLVGFRREIAVRLFAGSSDAAEESPSPGSHELEELAFAVVGIWLCATAAVYALEVEMNIWRTFSQLSAGGLGGDRVAYLNSADSWILRLPNFLEFVLGTLLFAGAGRVARFWRILRAAGRDRSRSAA